MTEKRWEDRLTTRTDQVEQKLLEHSEANLAVFQSLARAAACYWYGFEPEDFCLQSIGERTIVFGSTNRLIWSAFTGFRPDPSYCNARFLENAKRIGPIPPRFV